MEGSVQVTLILAIATTALTGPLAGMCLDQSIKQLPARRRIGVLAYSAYSRAGDHGNGLYLYPPMGIGTLLFAVAAAVSGHLYGLPGTLQAALDTSGILAILHSLATVRAALINLSQRKYDPTDEANLARVLDRFEFWNNLRTGLVTLNFAASLWATITLAGSR
jgi:hypothetical protein